MPIILFWAFAAMIRRAQDMRIAAQSMTEVAFRLAEPENLAQDRVMMIGQAVRREVAAMGEGIERTLARAVELETLVHSEVNQIERSYSENEARIRSLVDGLGSEREAVVTHAERVRASIAGAHETLQDELGSASDIIRDSILNASTKLSMTITNSGDTLIDRINESGMSIFDSVEGRLDTITDRLSTSGEAFASLLDTRIAKLTDSTDGLTRSLTDLLDDRTAGMVSLLGGAARTLNSEFEASLNGIERTLAERGQALISEFQTRAEALDTGTQKLNAALEARARQINETLVERAREIATHLRREQGHAVGDDRSGQDPDRRRHGRHRHLDLDACSRRAPATSPAAWKRRVTSSRAPSTPTSSGLPTPASASRKPSTTTAASWPKAATAWRPPCRPISRSSPRAAPASMTPSTSQVQKLAEGRDLISRALEEDLRKVDESRAAIDASLGSHLERLAGRPQQAFPGAHRRLRETCARPVRSLTKWLPGTSENSPKAATSCRAPWKPTSTSWPRAAPSIDGLVAGQVEKIAEGRAVLAQGAGKRHRRHQEPDRDPFRQAGRRPHPAVAVRSKTTSAGIRGLVDDHSSRLAEERSLLSQTLEADLAKLAESRSSIDGLVAGQVEKLAEGRDILKRALEADLDTIRGTIAEPVRKTGR